MTKMTAAIILVLASILANAIPVGAQQTHAPVVGTWDGIKALPSSDELTVKLKDGSSKKGRLADVTDTAVILSQGKKLAEIAGTAYSRFIVRFQSRATERCGPEPLWAAGLESSPAFLAMDRVGTA